MYLFKLNKSISSELTVAHKLMKPLTTDVLKKGCTSSFTNCEMYLFKLTQDVEFGKRAWNSHFNGGLGKRAWNSHFNGGLGI